MSSGPQIPPNFENPGRSHTYYLNAESTRFREGLQAKAWKSRVERLATNPPNIQIPGAATPPTLMQTRPQTYSARQFSLSAILGSGLGEQA